MTISLKHKYQSAIPDAGDPNVVEPSDWNDEHALVQATGTMLGRVSLGDGATEELSASQVRTLLNVANGATANSTDAFLLNRANHTGTQLAATISDFSTAADARVSAAIGVTAQAYSANLVSWAAVTRAAGYDAFAAAPSSANLLALLTSKTGTGNAVFSADPALTGAPTAPTQTPADNSTKIATTAYVQAAIYATTTLPASKYATTAALPAATYANGSSGVGATLTANANGALSVDGVAVSVNDVILVKNQASTFQNGVYSVTATGSAGAPFVLTRTIYYNLAADINLGDTTFVSAGSTLAGTSWEQNGTENPVIGTNPISFAQTAGLGTYTAGNGLSLVGTQFAINTAVTVDLTSTQTLSGKTLTSPAINSPTGIVKGDVGLGNVDNTSDATKNAATVTLTNKRITSRIGTVTSSATPTPAGDSNDVFTVTALAAGATFAAPTGTPTDGQRLTIRIKDSGTAQTLAWNAIYRAGADIALPTTTVISKTMYLGFIYNATDSKWDLVAKVGNI